MRDPTHSVIIPHREVAALEIENQCVMVYMKNGTIIKLPEVVDPYDLVYQWNKLHNLNI